MGGRENGRKGGIRGNDGYSAKVKVKEMWNKDQDKGSKKDNIIKTKESKNTKMRTECNRNNEKK